MKPWPVLSVYDADHLAKIAMPLGGIGTGSVCLGGRGDLRDWEIMNRPAKGFRPLFARGVAPFFAIRTQAKGQDPEVRILEGPLEPHEYDGDFGSPIPNHGLPRFRGCRFEAAYPLGQVHLSDRSMPVKVTLQAFNPLIPGDADRSGLPVAILRYRVTNRSRVRQSLAVAGTVPNFIGCDGSRKKPDWVCRPIAIGMAGNRNHRKSAKGLQGVFMDSQGVSPADPAWGTMAFATTASSGVTVRHAWRKEVRWGESLLDFWEDFRKDGALDTRCPTDDLMPAASISASFHLAPGATREVTFLIAWHFPNRQTWFANGCESDACDCSHRIGNYYCERFADAWHVARHVAGHLPALERDTLAFVNAFCNSSLPQVVKEAALFNLCIPRTQTCFRTPDGRLHGWEGICDAAGCCSGSCTHVWNYEQAVAHLFGDLSRTMRDVEFAHATDADGCMSFRVNLPLDQATSHGKAAADGQMGCLMKLYRDWQLSGDDDMLRGLWPHAKRSLEFCWLPGSWDADQDGVMEGCQHNTMDVEYFGPNPQMGTWYLGALKAAARMAEYLGETDFAQMCTELFARGSVWMDKNLFNGEWYEHQVVPPKRAKDVLPSLYVGMGGSSLTKPEYQLAGGCLVDQLVGQYMAHICGLGYLLKPSNIRRTLKSIFRYNRKRGFQDHFNNMRSYVLGDETALLMAAYPAERPERPFPYFSEAMTGFEYSAAIGMLQEGLTKQGLQCIADIRARYDGKKRNPFDEAECGHYYARAMASWGAVVAMSGFHYSAVDAALTFGATPGTWFWSTGEAWGICTIRSHNARTSATLSVKSGSLRLGRLILTGIGELEIQGQRRLSSRNRPLILTLRDV